jgi:hypothetical protein
VPLLDGLVGLAGGGSAITASSLLLYASAATGAYALWEQLRFRMARCAAGTCLAFLPAFWPYQIALLCNVLASPVALTSCLAGPCAGGAGSARTASWCRVRTA